MNTAKIPGWILTVLVILFCFWLFGAVLNVGVGLIGLLFKFAFGLLGLLFSKEGIMLLTGGLIAYLLWQGNGQTKRSFSRGRHRH